MTGDAVLTDCDFNRVVITKNLSTPLRDSDELTESCDTVECVCVCVHACISVLMKPEVGEFRQVL